MEGLASFHPAVRAWFERRFPAGPTEPQAEGWPAIASGHDALIAAPTGSGKTLAAFLVCIDRLFHEAGTPGALEEAATRVVYISPLKALAADIQQNLQTPLAEIRAVAQELGLPAPDLRVLLRTGDTPPSARAAMVKRPPHLLVTTPESLYLLVTAAKSRERLRSVSTVIVDEIHAVARDKRGAHLMLTLERLDALCAERPQRIGLSATQRPIETIARLLVGARSRRSEADEAPPCRVIDLGHRRALDLAVELPGSELQAVASHEQWGEILDKIAAHVERHRTTLVFVNTRRLAERLAHLLAERVGEDRVAAHHGSLSKERRLRLEDRLRAGDLKALVATASLELGIDIGPVELVCQIGSPRSLATFLQRVGRSGHARGATPRGRLYPTTRDELCECAAILRAVRTGKLDRVLPPAAPLDILAQQIVAACAAEPWREDELYALVRRAAAYADLPRADFDAVVEMLADGIQTGRGRRGAYVHRDRVNGVLRGRHSRDCRLQGGRRSGRDGGRHRQRGLGHREHGRRHLPPRQHIVEDPPGRGGRRAGGGRRGRAAVGALLARRGAGAHCRAFRRGIGSPRALGRVPGAGRRGGRPGLAHGRSGPRRRRGGAARPLPRGRSHGARRATDPAGPGLRALLRRDGRHAARHPRALRGADQPRPRPGAPQALLPPVRLRASGGGQR